MCPPGAETQAARRLCHCFMGGTVNQLLINLVLFIRDALLEFVNTGNLVSINPVLHDPPDLVINRIQLNAHFFYGKSLIIRRAHKCLVFL